jgi:predicted N-acetyltransferase YhbS
MITQKTFYKKIENRIAVLDIDLDLGGYQKEFPNVNFQNKPTFWISRLSVPEKLRNKKIATTLMTELINWLDNNEYNAIICANPYGDLNLNQLIKLYSKFGFTFNEHNIGYRLYQK